MVLHLRLRLLFTFRGLFEPPGADSLAAFVNTYDTTVQDERRAARRAAARVPVDDAVGQIAAGEVLSSQF